MSQLIFPIHTKRLLLRPFKDGDLAKVGFEAMKFHRIYGRCYAIWMYIGHDVDLARYFLPIVAAMCIVAALGLSQRRTISISILAFAVIMIGSVSIPLAYIHASTPPLQTQLAHYLADDANFTSGSFIADKIELFRFLRERSSPLRLVPIGANRELIEQRATDLERYNSVVLSTSWTLGEERNENWTAVARFCRNPYLRSRSPSELILYRYGSAAPSKEAMICPHKRKSE